MRREETIGAVDEGMRTAAEDFFTKLYVEHDFVSAMRGHTGPGFVEHNSHLPNDPEEQIRWFEERAKANPDTIAAGTRWADAEPGRLKELASAWEQAAWANTVFPLADGLTLSAVRRPAEAELERPLRLLPGTPKLERYRSSRLIALRSFTIEVDLDLDDGDEGFLVAHGDQGGGYALYVENGALGGAYNEYGRLHEIAAGRLAPGRHAVRPADPPTYGAKQGLDCSHEPVGSDQDGQHHTDAEHEVPAHRADRRSRELVLSQRQNREPDEGPPIAVDAADHRRDDGRARVVEAEVVRGKEGLLLGEHHTGDTGHRA